LTRNNLEKVLIAALLAGAAGVYTPAAFATPMGLLATANCPGGGVSVTSTLIDWTPTGPGGCTVTGDPTNVSYSGGSLLPGVTGTIQDITIGVTVLPLSNFMTFAGLNFTLSVIGPGPSANNCASLTPFETCAVYTGSPFGLTLLPDNSTIVSLPASGTVTDSTGTSNWSGAFTEPISNMTPAQVQSLICPGGALPCTGGGSSDTISTYAGHFTISAVVPEPATLSSILLGGLLIAGGLLRRRSGSLKSH
jgi:hypothetical protein